MTKTEGHGALRRCLVMEYDDYSNIDGILMTYPYDGINMGLICG